MYARIGGLRRPARRTLGSDIAGQVEAVGTDVTQFRSGDEVYGDNLDRMGGFAEYAVAPASALSLKPAELTFAQASTIPQAGAIALQGTAAVKPGQRVLINGAGGGSGSFAIQLAKRAGAYVVAVDNAGKLDFMRSVGADEVVDYRSQDFTRMEPVDHVLDLVAHRSVFAYRRVAETRRSLPLCRGFRAGDAAGDHRWGDPRSTDGTKPGRAHREDGPGALRTDG